MNEISIEITHECGLKCKMCSSNASYPSPVKNELTFDEIIRTLIEAKSLGAKEFSVSGGEPLQRSDTARIIKYAKSLGYRILFYTTGLFYDGERLIPDYSFIKWFDSRDKIIFDLQGHNSRIHDSIMGVDGAFDLTVNVAKKCIKNGLNVETHFVPQKDNWKHIEDYVYWLNDNGFKRTSFLRLVPQGRAKENDVIITKNEFKKLQEVIYDLRHRNDLNIKIRLGHPINFQFLIDPTEPVDSCRGGTDAPLITPWGSVHVCPAWKQLEHYSAGNIRNESIKNIWESSTTYRTFRWFIHKNGYLKLDKDSKCHSCEFFSKCKAKCVAQRLIAYSNKEPLTEAILLGSDPMCWHEP